MEFHGKKNIQFAVPDKWVKILKNQMSITHRKKRKLKKKNHKNVSTLCDLISIDS